MTDKKRILLTLLGLFGLALAIELCVVYYNANFAIDAKPSICAINEQMDCDGVARTSYSQFCGIPLSLWGVFLYLFFLFMTFVDKISEIKFLGFLKVFKNPASYIFSIASLSFAISMSLGFISIYKIGSVCIFCFMTYFVNLLIAITAKTQGISIFGEIKTTYDDFMSAMQNVKYFAALAILTIIGAGVLSYTSITNVLAPQMAKLNELHKYNALYENISDGTRAGAKDADLVIHEYMDFNCLGCFIAHTYLHSILAEFENVAVVQHNLPLDIQCNHNMKGEGHKNSCLKSYYALAAAKQNKYWQMSNILFDENVATENDIISKARMLNLDINKLKSDANSDEIKQEIINTIKDADSKEINSTPTLYIGMRKMLGIGTYAEFVNTIIEQGGRKKAEYAQQ